MMMTTTECYRYSNRINIINIILIDVSPKERCKSDIPTTRLSAGVSGGEEAI